MPIWKQEIKATQILQAQHEAEPPPKENATATIGQVQAEILNALVHYIELKKSLQLLSNTNCIELQRLGFDGLIARLEGIIQKHPSEYPGGGTPQSHSAEGLRFSLSKES